MIARLIEGTGQCEAINVAIAVSVRIKIVAHRIDGIGFIHSPITVVVNKVTLL